MAQITDLGVETAIADADYVVFRDTSVTRDRRILWSNVLLLFPIQSESATRSVFAGIDAGAADDGGQHGNVAIGWQAFYTNEDGTNSVAIGYQALYTSNTTAEPANGHNNVAVGFQAGYSNYGEHNAIVGFQAHMYGTLAADNVAVGSMAMQRNEVGDFGVAVGFGALQYNEAATLDWRNTAVGFGAGRGAADVTSSINNTFIGYYAGRANTTGNGNVLLGYQAGDNLTTGSGNIVIGNDIDAPAVGSNNTLNIGNWLFGTGLSGTDGTLSTGAKIGIGTASPAYTLDLRGNMYISLPSASGLSNLTLGDASNGTISGIRTINNVFEILHDGSTVGMQLSSNLLNVVGTMRADGLRLDVTPTSETPSMTHTITVSLNGTNYKIPCVAA